MPQCKTCGHVIDQFYDDGYFDGGLHREYHKYDAGGSEVCSCEECDSLKDGY